jgi:hypothetical protein
MASTAIQLKASHLHAKTNRQNVNVNLATRPGGCVLWFRFDAATLAFGPYLWFGSDAGAPAPSLGDIVAKHAKGDGTGLKAPRPNIRVLKQNQFRSLETIDEVAATSLRSGLFPILRAILSPIQQHPQLAQQRWPE